MRLIKRIGIGALIGSWVGWALAGAAMGQGNSQGTASSRAATTSDWAARVLQQTNSPRASAQQARADQQRMARSAPVAPSNAPAAAPAPRPSSGATRLTPFAEAVEAESVASRPARAAQGEIVLAQQTEVVPASDEVIYEPGVMYDQEVVGQWVDEDGYYYGGNPGVDGLFSAWWAEDLALVAGGHAFKGPFDQGINGNFGLHEGVEFGAPLGGVPGWGYEVGFLATQSNFSADETNGPIPGVGRDQLFFTAGLFKRALAGGLQWGVAFDLLRDSYYAKADMKQVRAEIGYLYPGGRAEFGFWGAFGVGDDEVVVNDSPLVLEPTDLFAVYLRRHFETGGEGRLWGGCTGNGDGLFGADVRVPLGGNWALENRFNYLIPKEGSRDGGPEEESWGLSINLVWYLGQPAAAAQQSVYRPLMGVADNGVFMVDTPAE